MPELSVVCVTNGEGGHVERFVGYMVGLARRLGAELVLGLDGEHAQGAAWAAEADVQVMLHGTGVVESVLDQALAACSGEWVLRLDDDETVSLRLEDWLVHRDFRGLGPDVYSFPRAYLWGDERHYVANDPLWPDWQTRLTVREKAGGRRVVHQGSPWGAGRLTNLPILHHKFLVRSLDERLRIAARYELAQAGAGLGEHFGKFNLPERYLEGVEVREVGDWGERVG